MKATENTFKGSTKAAGEALIILLFSALVGISWNHTLLLKAWKGEATGPAAGTTPAVATAAAEDPMPLGLEQAKELFNAGDTLFIDARDRGAFASGHLKGAVSLPLADAKQRGKIALPPRVTPKTTVITYCNGFSCHDSMELGKILLKAGYTTVYVYEGGFPEWRDAGYPVEKGGA
ncbi:rhodanese-like domain-containing protein [Geomesophilobacter sediminis]|uniref:Sulfurtransferase n=1 Tax=Geomesophilobacter sediminis TaxID=2798584 RepID=A0A8J7M0X8_9BACT|nr:rhodanese-like domain-containing protein [Geomesophilobacter sediminis]MBJ6726605.1 rhodanese-like domain-containing protein [Geomesophilobacter sediminis]